MALLQFGMQPAKKLGAYWYKKSRGRRGEPCYNNSLVSLGGNKLVFFFNQKTSFIKGYKESRKINKKE